MIKYSRQREAIKNNLIGRTDHPTAEMVYEAVKEEYPNISLGTVYRNLKLLADHNEIMKISCGEGMERFDGNSSPHYHFICDKCHRVIDLKVKSLDIVEAAASNEFDGIIKGHFIYFSGECKDCVDKFS